MGRRLIGWLQREGPLIPLVLLSWAVTIFWFAVVAVVGTSLLVGAGLAAWEATGWPPPPERPVALLQSGSALAVFGVALVRECRRSIRRSDEWLVDHRRGRLLARDEVGALWLLEREWEGRRTVVEVLDATPRADGSRARYLLRVPPHVTTPREAVAWTFGFENASDYRPLVEA